MGRHSRISSFQGLARNGAADPNRSPGMLSIWLLPKDSPLINMDAHLASSRLTPPHTHTPTLCWVNPWSQTGGRQRGNWCACHLQEQGPGLAWPEYYMRPSIPALPPLPNPCEGRMGAGQASKASHLLCNRKVP